MISKNLNCLTKRLLDIRRYIEIRIWLTPKNSSYKNGLQQNPYKILYCPETCQTSLISHSCLGSQTHCIPRTSPYFPVRMTKNNEHTTPSKTKEKEIKRKKKLLHNSCAIRCTIPRIFIVVRRIPPIKKTKARFLENIIHSRVRRTRVLYVRQDFTANKRYPYFYEREHWLCSNIRVSPTDSLLRCIYDMEGHRYLCHIHVIQACSSFTTNGSCSTIFFHRS